MSVLRWLLMQRETYGRTHYYWWIYMERLCVMCVYSSTIRITIFGSSPFHPQSACCSSVMQTTALCSSLRHWRNDKKINPVICIFDIWRNLIHNNHIWKLNSIHIHIYLFFRIFLCVIVLYHIHRKTVQQPISAIIMQRHLRGKHPTHRATCNDTQQYVLHT